MWRYWNPSVCSNSRYWWQDCYDQVYSDSIDHNDDRFNDSEELKDQYKGSSRYFQSYSLKIVNSEENAFTIRASYRIDKARSKITTWKFNTLSIKITIIFKRGLIGPYRLKKNWKFTFLAWVIGSKDFVCYILLGLVVLKC